MFTLSKRICRSGGLILLALVAYPQTVLAYQGLPPLPEDIWRAWSWEPQVLLGLGLAAWVYTKGVRVLWARAGVGRGILWWQTVAFGGGLLALFIALISPLNAFGRALFSAHMVQHLMLTLVAVPLLVLGAPVVAFLWALPKPARHALGHWWRQTRVVNKIWRGLTQPMLVWSLYSVTLWIWHLPSLYQAALERVFVHELEHASFLGTALLFWWTLIYPGGHRRLGPGADILYVFTTAVHSGALGMLLTFARIPLYPIYTSSAAAWNLTVLEDQQVAGAFMGIPGGIVYLVTALALLGRWLQAMEKKDRRNQETATRRESLE